MEAKWLIYIHLASTQGLSSGLLEEVFLEAFLNHRADAGACAAVTVEHGCIGLVGFALPEFVAFLVKDRGGEPGAGAVEDHLLLGLNAKGEIGLRSL